MYNISLRLRIIVRWIPMCNLDAFVHDEVCTLPCSQKYVNWFKSRLSRIHWSYLNKIKNVNPLLRISDVRMYVCGIFKIPSPLNFIMHIMFNFKHVVLHSTITIRRLSANLFAKSKGFQRDVLSIGSEHEQFRHI